MEKMEVDLKETLGKQNVIRYLEDLVNGLKAETVCIQAGEDMVTLKPSKIFEIVIEASSKKDKEALAVKLSWETEKPIFPDELNSIEFEPELEMCLA